MGASRMINEGLFSSKTDNWSTPQEFFDELDKEFNFTTDVCDKQTISAIIIFRKKIKWTD